MAALRGVSALRFVGGYSASLTVAAKANAARQLLARSSGTDEGYSAASRIFEDNINQARRFARLHLEIEEAARVRPQTRDDIVYGFRLATNAIQLFKQPSNDEVTQAFNSVLASARARIADLPKKYTERRAPPPKVVAHAPQATARTNATTPRTTEFAKVINDVTLQRGWLSGRLLVRQPSRETLTQFMQSFRVADLRRQGIDVQWARTVHHVDQGAFVAHLDYSLDPLRLSRPLKRAIEERVDAEVSTLLSQVTKTNSRYGPLHVSLASSVDAPHYSQFIHRQVAPRMAEHGVALRYRALSQSEAGVHAVLQFRVG